MDGWLVFLFLPISLITLGGTRLNGNSFNSGLFHYIGIPFGSSAYTPFPTITLFIVLLLLRDMLSVNSKRGVSGSIRRTSHGSGVHTYTRRCGNVEHI